MVKNYCQPLGITTASTLTSHAISKGLNKKKGGSININLKQSDINKINDMLNKLPSVIKDQLHINFKNINKQNGGSILGTIAMLAASILPSLISGKGYCEKDNFFLKKLNDKNLYPISNFKINEILKNDKNYIGTFSKNNVPILKNNQSTIVNLADSHNKGTHWVAIKFINNKLFYFDSYGIEFIPDII